jgi:diguanylate cyclase (GGDEF)-like protein
MLSAFCLAGFVVSFLRQRVARLLSILARAARIDPLTGVLNRGGFEERFGQEVERVRRSGECVTLLVADVDRFKQINDRFGHAVGDQILEGVARVLSEATRPADVVARLGGEEFGVLLPGSTRDEGVDVAERCRHEIARMAPPECGPVAVTVSFGVATFPDDGSCRDSLFRQADAAVYAAKDLGRDRVVACAPASDAGSALQPLA